MKEGFVMAKIPDWPILRKGSRGVNVTALQCLLYYHGFKIAIDGDFGTGTAAAVTNFQRNHRLSQDGAAGPDTLSTMIVKQRGPTVEPTKSNGTWGQIKQNNGPIEYPANSGYGAFVIYKVVSSFMRKLDCRFRLNEVSRQ